MSVDDVAPSNMEVVKEDTTSNEKMKFSSPTRHSSGSVDPNKLITPFQDLSPTSQATLSYLSKPAQRKIQAAAMSAAAKPASSTPGVSNHAVSSTDATPQTGNTGHRGSKFAKIGMKPLRRLSKKGDLFGYGGNSKSKCCSVSK